MYDLEQLRRRTESVAEYLASAVEKNPAFARRLEEYRLDASVADEVRRYADRAAVVVFSAEWCKDCARNLPVLGLLAKETGLEVRVFGHLMRNPLRPAERWKVPPSPPEVREFGVVRIPHILVVDKRGELLGEVVENPPEGETLERALLRILSRT